MSEPQLKDLIEHYLPELYQDQRQKLTQFLFLLRKWNRVYNLTSITTAHAMVIRHILDSVSIAPYVEGENILDVGTGAGLPGVPLSIIQEDKEFFLLDSNSKKVRFLKQLKMELDLDNVTIIPDRVENYQSPICFDTIVSRAFSSLNDFLLLSQHLVCANGRFLAMKGVYPISELEHIAPGFKIDEVVKLQVPDLEAERHVIRVRKG